MRLLRRICDTSHKNNVFIIAEDVSGLPALGRSLEDGGFGCDYRLAMNIPDYVSLDQT